MDFRDNVAPWLLFILAILLGLDLYEFSLFQLSVFNIGAFFLTLTGLNQGSIYNKKINFGSMIFKKINIAIGIFMIILAAFANGFKYYFELENFILKIDTNALLLLGIAVTLWSFKLSDDKQEIIVEKSGNQKLNYKEKFLHEKEIRLMTDEKNKELTRALKEANQIIHKLEESKGKK